MKRREFSLTSASVLAGSALVLSPIGSAHAQGKAPVAGTDYLVLDKPVPTDAPAGKVEVIEFFWYACPHCFAFEPALVAWLKKLPKNVAFRRVPVVFQDSFIPPQKLYYTLEAMGQLEAVHEKVFNAIHVERQKLDKDSLVIDWAIKQGLDKAKFVETYNSFSVATKVRKAAQLQEAYKVAGVPAMGVAGRFYTDGTQAQSMERGLTVVDYLVSQQKT
ncbi:thiol:disulfide interchange protein DsbA/DsbL [Rhodoferax sp.]|uniref:thiol:disulfide interchange protein DsbA/DsbL n=1 Tax=Rhodoferax sp. TaxID=50421 RepID=UPI0025DFE2E4|nr:thiol:disulfide interchange protein DsbA/DsbL [Rhodoferax sp.]